jgi:hypothetical protein
VPGDVRRDALPDGLRDALCRACAILSIVLLVFLIASRLFYKQLHMSREFEFDRLAIATLAAGFSALGLFGSRLGPRWTRWTLTAASLLLSLSAAVVAGLLVSVDVAGRIKQVVTKVVFREHHADIYTTDDRYGYLLRPGARDRERTSDYDVLYSVDGAGYRVTPSPAAPRATVMMIGDSFTFGTGVDDRDTFTSVLGSRYWPDVKVINAGVFGWGLTQSYLKVLDTLARPPLPTAIVLGMIPDDQYRSYLRRPVTEGMTRRLEFVDDAFVLRDVHDATGAVAITPELEAREVALNQTLLRRMFQACRERSVGFAAVLMQDDGRYAPDLIHSMGALGIPMVDLTRLEYRRFTHDYHPNAADHRRIAQGIAASLVSGLFVDRP